MSEPRVKGPEGTLQPGPRPSTSTAPYLSLPALFRGTCLESLPCGVSYTHTHTHVPFTELRTSWARRPSDSRTLGSAPGGRDVEHSLTLSSESCQGF